MNPAALLQNFPNPFNSRQGKTTIRYQLPVSSPVVLAVHDVAGRLIRSLDSGYRQLDQTYMVTWDGRGLDGQPVASGVYFYRLQWAGGQTQQKLVLLR